MKAASKMCNKYRDLSSERQRFCEVGKFAGENFQKFLNEKDLARKPAVFLHVSELKCVLSGNLEL